MSGDVVEQAKELLQRWNDGDVDNAFEGLQEAEEILKVLPASETELRAALLSLSEECGEILAEVYGE